MGTACDLKIRVVDLDLTVRLSFKFRVIGVDTTCTMIRDITDHGVCSIQIQVALPIQIDAAAAASIRDQRKVDVVQSQIRVADQVGRSSCATFMGMSMRIDIQRKIFKRDITVRCIHTVLVQRQRVGIAMGMTYQPKLLLADEPTSALDVTTQAQIVRQMMELRDDYGTGIIVVTHNLGVAAYMSDYIVVMKDGHIEDQGDRDHILHHSENDYTRRLLSAVPSMGGESYV